MTINRGLVAGSAVALLFSSAVSAATCSVDAPGVSFGIYNPLEGAAVDGVGSITVSCDTAAPYQITLGTGASGTYAVREMASGAELMRYNLYTSASRSMVWGDGTAGTATVDASAVDGTFAIYGRIEGGQNLPAGVYADTLIVTLVY